MIKIMVVPETTYELQEQTAKRPPANTSGESQHPRNTVNRRTWDGKSFLVAIATLGALLAIYLLRLDTVVGQFKDDGWYVVLARALASGQGYNMINLPQHAGLYFYPPLFPLLLSLLYRLSPEFPRNVFLLKSASIVSMLALAVFVFQFFNRRDRLPRSLAYLVAFTTAAAPCLVMLATSTVMSECLFTALSFATLLRVDSCSEEKQGYPFLGNVIVTALLASACYLTRTIGIALVAAIVVHFLARRMFKSVCVFVLATAVCVAPWMLYKHFRSSNNSRSPVAETYSSQFWDRQAGSGTKITARDLPARVWQMSTVIVGDDVGGLIMPSLYRSPSESGEEILGMTAVIPYIARNAIGMYGVTMGLAVAGQVISACFSLLVLIGCFRAVRKGLECAELFFVFSLIMIVVWPWNPIRFLVPLVPFFLYFLVLGIGSVYERIVKKAARLSMPDPWTASRIALVCILAFFIYDNAMYIVARHKNPKSYEHPHWLRDFNAFQEAANWVHEHTPANEVITGDNLPTTYLYTQRKTSMCIAEKCPQEGIRYYISTEGIDLSIPSKVVFPTESFGIKVLDISRHD